VLTGGLGSISISDSGRTVSLAPFIDYFVANGFSLGGGLAFARTTSSGISAGAIGVSVRGGWNFSLASRLSLWPFVRFGLTSTSGGQETLSTTIEIPLLVHIVPHFFLAGAVYATSNRPIDDNGSALGTSGLTSFIGGWW